jgi:hypothetical protein
MKYAYEDLGEHQFEQLVSAICSELFGIGVQPFGPGPDGGRDAKFVGRANEFPSDASRWDGTTIIQAKHTNGQNQRFSDSDFFSATSASCVVVKEIPRIKRLFESGELHYYALFSNRKLTGNAQQDIVKYIAENTGVPEESIHLVGVEYLEQVLRLRPNIATALRIDPVDSPLNVSPDELAEVVEAFSKEAIQTMQLGDSIPVTRISYEDKNLINGMDATYAKEQRKRYLPYTTVFKEFLAKPENQHLQQLYDTAVEEFELRILSKRQDYQSFDQVLEYLVDLLFKRDNLLRTNKRLTRALLFYMYWNCDIGLEEQDDLATE